eukprot:837532_1
MPVRRICIRKKICSFRPQSRPQQFFQYRSCSQLLQQLSKKDVHRPSKKPDKWCNVTDHILSKVGHNLHKDTHNPVGIIKNKIEEYFSERYKDKNVSIRKEVSFPDKVQKAAIFHPAFDKKYTVTDVFGKDAETIRELLDKNSFDACGESTKGIQRNF